eukprot:235312-Ditylum_brightwellii.AAC.1
MESSPKRRDKGNNNSINTPTLERRKRFHPMPYQTKQATKASKQKDYLSTAEQIKLQGVAAIDTVTEVVTPVTIEFLVPNQ